MPGPVTPPEADPGLALSLESSFFGFYAHAGFTAGLIENGVRPRFFTGSSAGSVIALFTAAGFTPEEIRNIIFGRRFKWSFWELKSFLRGFGMMAVLPGINGLTSFRDARRYFTRLLEDRAPNLEDCQYGEVSIAVANLTRMRSEILRTGDSAAAVLASCAVPCLVTAQKLPDGHCWDGGIADSSPILHYADDDRVRTVISHHIRHPAVAADRWQEPDFRPRISDTLSRAHHLIAGEFQRLHLRIMESSGKALLPVTTDTLRPGLFSRRSVETECYRHGWERAAAFAASRPPATDS